MIDDNEGFVSTSLAAKKRLKIIRKRFSTPEEDLLDNMVFAKKTGIAYETVNSWGEDARNAKGGLQQKTKSSINSTLGLQPEVWTDTFYEEQLFYSKLDRYRNITQPEQIIDQYKITDKYILEDIAKMTMAEEDEIEFFSQDTIIKIPGNLENYSSDFMFALAKLLKSKNQAKDALNVLGTLQSTAQNFKFTYHKKIEHLKAILLSHTSIQKWDEAIEILKYLYADGYHLKEPEVITLTASNYKRKALHHSNGMLNHADQVNLDLLGAALTLYHEAYGLKDVNEKYYDAVNIAYLVAILHTLEKDEESIDPKIEIKSLYDELVHYGWKADETDWWQIASKMEILVLLGDDAEAETTYASYQGKPEKFDIETTIRQLEIYTHFCSGSLEKDFLNFLKDEAARI